MKKLVSLGLITFTMPLTFISQFVYLFVRPEAESIQKYGHLVDPIFLSSSGQLPKFVANSFDNILFCLNIIIMSLAAISTYLVAVFFGIGTYRKLNSMKHLMSSKTLRLNRSMTNILIVKVR